MNNFTQKIKDNKKFLLIFLAIMLVGIFLRTYHYSDLLRFGKDQARDATIIHEIIAGERPMPLLGPENGGVKFYMGPAFYYFQYASAKIFGASPDKMAYPDLIFSILTIPVFFLFLRKFFERNISLALTTLYAVSFFAVQNGRFAWNPNSLPLFSLLFLYSFLELANPKQKRIIFFAVLGGIALGVGVQLHTLYIIIVGLTFFLSSIYLIRKKMLNFKNVATIIAIMIVLNLPQIFSEIKTGFQNSKAFFIGTMQKPQEKKDLSEDSRFLSVYWHIQANTMFVYPAGDDTKSQFLSLFNKIEKNKKGLPGIVKNYEAIMQLSLGTALSIFGYFLLGFFLKKESDEQKKLFLKLVVLYVIISFLVLIPLSHVLVLRYFLILEFIPFILLGLIMKFLREKFDKRIFYASFAVILILGIFNCYTIYKEFKKFNDGKGDVGIAIWSEEKLAGEFIIAHSEPSQKIYFVFEPQNANKFIRSLAYFRNDVSFPFQYGTGEPINERNVTYFSLILNTKRELSDLNKKLAKSQYIISDSASFGRLAIFKLELK